MAGLPSPGKARGDAKNFGDTLVREGLARVVTSPARGDIVVWKDMAAPYGHTGIVLSGNRVFEQNINAGAVQSKLVYYQDAGGVTRSQRVYASRIGSLSESFRRGTPTFYRLNGYKEDDMITPTQVDKALKMGLQREPTEAELNNQGYQQDPGLLIDTLWNNGGKATYGRIKELEAQVGSLTKQNASLASQLEEAKNKDGSFKDSDRTTIQETKALVEAMVKSNQAKETL